MTRHLTILLLLIAGAGCAAPRPAPNFVEQADRLHDKALASTVVVDTDLNDYLQEVGHRIVHAAKVAAPQRVNEDFLLNVKVELVVCNTINAFSTGGAHVYVTTALFSQCQNEEELVAALTHAYAHLIDLDIESLKMKPEPSVPLSIVAWDFVQNRYTLDQERRADSLALNTYMQGGWDISQFTLLFERMESITGGNVAADREPLPSRVGRIDTLIHSGRRPQRRLPVADRSTFAMLRQKAANYREPNPPGVPQIFLRAIPNCVLSNDTAEQKAAQERLRPIERPPVKTLEPS